MLRSHSAEVGYLTKTPISDFKSFYQLAVSNKLFRYPRATAEIIPTQSLNF